MITFNNLLIENKQDKNELIKKAIEAKKRFDEKHKK